MVARLVPIGIIWSKRATREPSNLARIFAGLTQPDHLKRFFALFGTRSLFPKDPVPALAQETHFLVPNFSEFKILTEFDGFRHRQSGSKPRAARKLGLGRLPRVDHGDAGCVEICGVARSQRRFPGSTYRSYLRVEVCDWAT